MSHIDDTPERLDLVEERLHVSKREVETDYVRIRTVLEELPVVLNEVVERGVVEIVRVPIDRAVTAQPAPREEGDTLIISVVEERPVVEKRLFVVEEIHIRRAVIREPVSLPATVRKMHAVIERAPIEGSADDRPTQD